MENKGSLSVNLPGFTLCMIALPRADRMLKISLPTVYSAQRMIITIMYI